MHPQHNDSIDVDDSHIFDGLDMDVVEQLVAPDNENLAGLIVVVQKEDAGNCNVPHLWHIACQGLN